MLIKRLKVYNAYIEISYKEILGWFHHIGLLIELLQQLFLSS
jgi:hypothetical protein